MILGNFVSVKNLVIQLCQKMFSNNHIAVLFDHQYIWKKSMNTSDFLHGNNHQREEVPHLEFIFTDTIGVMPTKI